MFCCFLPNSRPGHGYAIKTSDHIVQKIFDEKDKLNLCGSDFLDDGTIVENHLPIVIHQKGCVRELMVLPFNA